MRHWLTIVLMVLPMLSYAHQDTVYHHADTTSGEEYKYYIDLTKKPDAVKAVWLGAIFPGAGQMYNRSYWKLPIVYGAFMGCGYAVMWTNNRCTNYKNAYIDLYNDVQAGTVTEDPSKSYIAVIPDGYDLSRVGGASTWMNTLKNRQSIYRRYRDYSILATIAVYALTLVDAYVDAQLFDYDISPDLTLNVEPQIYYDLQHRQSAEVKLAIQF
ncbi:MAG: hypothetical protein II605_06975 [Paludibacteraceae bacterium]|nr:hypothetical protein [Paludibacteraceae bacterium]MBQ2519868.1 hypothetical protein [Paludibacteraceae bacterium]MBQ4018966.1 hypothetical protein [Paludibacteraceae bacterium]